MVDQGTRLRLGGRCVVALELGQIRQKGRQVECARLGRRAQADLTTAAEIQLQAPEQGGGAGQRHGDLAQRLVGQGGVGGQGVDGIHELTP